MEIEKILQEAIEKCKYPEQEDTKFLLLEMAENVGILSRLADFSIDKPIEKDEVKSAIKKLLLNTFLLGHSMEIDLAELFAEDSD